MPKKNDRNVQDFSKYDSMTSEELAQLLRLDSEAPEGNGLDIDTLLYITGVLAEREKINNNTGKTAQEAWISFQQHYMPSEEECLETEEAKPVKSRNPWVRRAIAAAAAVVLIVAAPLTAKAFNWEEIWTAVASWAKETFSFVREDQPEVDPPATDNTRQYDSLEQALSDTKRQDVSIPTWIPDGFTLDRVDIDETPMQRNYVALYKKGEQSINICVRFYEGKDPERIETNEEYVETYIAQGIEYFIYDNNGWVSAAWIRDSYEGYISGEITIKEIKLMIDSIPKG